MTAIKRSWRCLETPQKPKFDTAELALKRGAHARATRLSKGLSAPVTEPYLCPSCGWYHNRTVKR